MSLTNLRISYIFLILVLDLLLQFLFKHLTFGVFNTGVSFGLFPGLGQGVGVWLYVVIIIYLLYLYLLHREVPLILIVMGGLGNIFFRLLWGGVWDYIRLFPFNIWINLSDLLISAGVILYLWHILSKDGNTRNI